LKVLWRHNAEFVARLVGGMASLGLQAAASYLCGSIRTLAIVDSSQ
jgi:hypothetical protein